MKGPPFIHDIHTKDNHCHNIIQLNKTEKYTHLHLLTRFARAASRAVNPRSTARLPCTSLPTSDTSPWGICSWTQNLHTKRWRQLIIFFVCSKTATSGTSVICPMIAHHQVKYVEIYHWISGSDQQMLPASSQNGTMAAAGAASCRFVTSKLTCSSTSSFTPGCLLDLHSTTNQPHANRRLAVNDLNGRLSLQP